MYTIKILFVLAGILDALNSLIKVVNLEVRKCEASAQAIDQLRRLIEQCELCKAQPIQRPSCATHPPNCAPGVRCHDTAEGPRCGSCPRGTIGDGEYTKKYIGLYILHSCTKSDITQN